MANQTAWILLKFLSVRNGGLTVCESAREMDVSQKTVRRDVATFPSGGFAIDERTGEFGRKSYRIEPRWSKPVIVTPKALNS